MWHARAAFRAFVTNDDYVTRHDLIAQDSMPGVVLRIVALGRAAEFPGSRVYCAELYDGAVRTDVPVQDGKAALLVDRVLYRVDNLGIFILSQSRFVGDGAEHALGGGINFAGLRQLLHHGTQAACGLELLHGIGGVVRINGADDRHLTADGIKGLRCDITAHLTCQRRDVQHTVGASARGHHIAHHIFKAFLPDDVAGAHFILPRLHHLTRCSAGQLVPTGRLAPAACRAMGGKAQHFGHGTHRVSCAHKGAGARCGASVPHDSLIVLFAHIARNVGGICLLGVCECEHAAFVTARSHITAGKHHCRDIDAQRTHKHTGYNLVTGGHNDHTFQHVQLRNRLHLCGDHVPGRQCIAVARGIAADTVADTRDGQFQRKTPGPIDFFLHLSDNVLERKMAGIHLVP